MKTKQPAKQEEVRVWDWSNDLDKSSGWWYVLSPFSLHVTLVQLLHQESATSKSSCPTKVLQAIPSAASLWFVNLAYLISDDGWLSTFQSLQQETRCTGRSALAMLIKNSSQSMIFIFAVVLLLLTALIKLCVINNKDKRVSVSRAMKTMIPARRRC